MEGAEHPASATHPLLADPRWGWDPLPAHPWAAPCHAAGSSHLQAPGFKLVCFIAAFKLQLKTEQKLQLQV